MEKIYGRGNVPSSSELVRQILSARGESDATTVVPKSAQVERQLLIVSSLELYAMFDRPEIQALVSSAVKSLFERPEVVTPLIKPLVEEAVREQFEKTQAENGEELKRRRSAVTNEITESGVELARRRFRENTQKRKAALDLEKKLVEESARERVTEQAQEVWRAERERLERELQETEARAQEEVRAERARAAVKTAEMEAEIKRLKEENAQALSAIKEAVPQQSVEPAVKDDWYNVEMRRVAQTDGTEQPVEPEIADQNEERQLLRLDATERDAIDLTTFKAKIDTYFTETKTNNSVRRNILEVANSNRPGQSFSIRAGNSANFYEKITAPVSAAFAVLYNTDPPALPANLPPNFYSLLEGTIQRNLALWFTEFITRRPEFWGAIPDLRRLSYADIVKFPENRLWLPIFYALFGLTAAFDSWLISSEKAPSSEATYNLLVLVDGIDIMRGGSLPLAGTPRQVRARTRYTQLSRTLLETRLPKTASPGDILARAWRKLLPGAPENTFFRFSPTAAAQNQSTSLLNIAVEVAKANTAKRLPPAFIVQILNPDAKPLDLTPRFYDVNDGGVTYAITALIAKAEGTENWHAICRSPDNGQYAFFDCDPEHIKAATVGHCAGPFTDKFLEALKLDVGLPFSKKKEIWASFRFARTKEVTLVIERVDGVFDSIVDAATFSPDRIQQRIVSQQMTDNLANVRSLRRTPISAALFDGWDETDTSVFSYLFPPAVASEEQTGRSLGEMIGQNYDGFALSILLAMFKFSDYLDVGLLRYKTNPSTDFGQWAVDKFIHHFIIPLRVTKGTTQQWVRDKLDPIKLKSQYGRDWYAYSQGHLVPRFFENKLRTLQDAVGLGYVFRNYHSGFQNTLELMVDKIRAGNNTALNTFIALSDSSYSIWPDMAPLVNLGQFIKDYSPQGKRLNPLPKLPYRFDGPLSLEIVSYLEQTFYPHLNQTLAPIAVGPTSATTFVHSFFVLPRTPPGVDDNQGTYFSSLADAGNIDRWEALSPAHPPNGFATLAVVVQSEKSTENGLGYVALNISNDLRSMKLAGLVCLYPSETAPDTFLCLMRSSVTDEWYVYGIPTSGIANMIRYPPTHNLERALNTSEELEFKTPTGFGSLKGASLLRLNVCFVFYASEAYFVAQ
jgi:hypothetical protein